MKYLALPFAAVGMVLAMVGLLFALAVPAEATRPVPGYNYKDVCKNVKGDQFIYEVIGAVGRYKFDLTTARPNDCVARWSPR